MATSPSHSDIEVLRRELSEAYETLRAIREGEVDAFVLQTRGSYRVETLGTADAPYRVLVESMRDGAVTVSAEGTVLYCNRPFAEQVGLTPAQVIGQPVTRWLELNADLHDLLEESSRSEARSDGTLSKLGTSSPVAVTFCSLPTGEGAPVFCLLLTDLSERVVVEQLRTQQAVLARQRAELDAITRCLPFAVLLAENPGEFGYANPAAQSLIDQYPGLRNRASEAAAQVLSRGITTSDETVVPIAGDGELTFRLYATPLDMVPSVPHALIVLEDVTGERQAMKSREREDQLREAFVGILGHDLRTPLMAITTSAELLSLDPTPARAAFATLAGLFRSAGADPDIAK